jgi:hypothetical protein
MKPALVGVTLPGFARGHVKGHGRLSINPMQVALPDPTRQLVTLLHGADNDPLGRLISAVWTRDNGMALDFEMRDSDKARALLADLADPDYPMYAHPMLTPVRIRRDYAPPVAHLTRVNLWAIESWPTATVRIVRGFTRGASGNRSAAHESCREVRARRAAFPRTGQNVSRRYCGRPTTLASEEPSMRRCALAD